MANYLKYECFVGDLAGKVHDLLGVAASGADSLKLALTARAYVLATDAVFATISEIAAGNGYTATGHLCGNAAAGNTGTRTGGTFTLVCADTVWTATGTMVGFRYIVMYNSIAAGGPLISVWDYNSTLVLNNGETFTVDFGVNTFTLT